MRGTTGQACNLSTVIVRPDDSVQDLLDKVELATILGTFQATLTNFRYLRKQWQKSCEEEALLGVSMTGILDHPLLNGEEYLNGDNDLVDVLTLLRDKAIATNKIWSKKLGIKESTAITCIKPEGCRPKDALTVLDSGIYTLEELEPEEEGEWTNISGNTHGGEVKGFYRNGEAEVFQIQMNHGMTVESTRNHKWFVNGEWKRTDEIQEGDILEITSGTYLSTKVSYLRTIDKPGDGRTIPLELQPTELTNDLCWLFGYLWGDGCLSPNCHKIRFTDGNLQNLIKARNILLDNFGLVCNIKRCTDREAWTMEKGSRHLWEWIKLNGLYKYQDINRKIANIPLIIRTSSRDNIICFIAGMVDSDGCYSSGSNALCFSNSDADFSKHFQEVAWSVGLCFGRSHNTKGENKQPVKSMWLLNLNSNTNSDSYDVLFNNSNKIKGKRKFNRIFKAGKVSGVSLIGVLQTFDIETENHWFMAGPVKSHNTVSQLTDTASGIHPRYSEYYIRTIRADNKDPLCIMMKEQGIPNEPDVMKPDSTTIFSFPINSPDSGCVFRNDRTALQQLEIWKVYQLYWCEHKPSVTIYVKEEEWVDVFAWVYKNFDIVSGISFLPHTNHSYKQAPYQEIDKETFDNLKSQEKTIEWEKLVDYEKIDATTSTKEYACSAGSCDIV